MKRFIFLLMIMTLVILPASANNITITAEPLGGSINILPSHQSGYSVDVSKLQRNAIQRITVDVPSGSTIDYTLWYGNGSTISGQMIYNEAAAGTCGYVPLIGTPYPCQHSSVSIGSSLSQHDYVGTPAAGRIDIIGYGRDTSDPNHPQRVFLIYDTFAGVYLPTDTIPFVSGDAMAYSPISTGVIYAFTLSSNQPMTSANYYTNTQANVQKASETSIIDAITEFGNLLIKIKDTVIEVFWFGYYIAEFLWDNIYLIIALYFALTGAMCVSGQKSIFRAMQKWFGMQRSLLHFILGLWDTLIGLITKILK